MMYMGFPLFATQRRSSGQDSQGRHKRDSSGLTVALHDGVYLDPAASDIFAEKTGQCQTDPQVSTAPKWVWPSLWWSVTNPPMARCPHLETRSRLRICPDFLRSMWRSLLPSLAAWASADIVGPVVPAIPNP